jgi:hypothetical protein
MKNNALASIILGFISTTASADLIHITGEKAAQLMNDLEKIGVQPTVIPGSHRFKIFDVNCSYGAITADGPLSECGMKQLISGPTRSNYVRIQPYSVKGALAFQLIQDLQEAGIQGDPNDGITTYSISTIQCTQMVTSGPIYLSYTCQLEEKSPELF